MPRLVTRLKYLRLLHGVTQDQLAREAQCSKSTLSHIESTGIPPNADVVARLAKALGIKPQELYARDTEEADPLSFERRTAKSVA